MNDAIKILDHTADLAIRIHAESEIDLFKLGARALYQALGKLVADNTAAENFTLELQAGNQEDLFHDWLAELLYHAQTQRVIFDQFEFESLSPTHVRAIAQAKPLDLTQTEFQVEIKAVTYHHLQIQKNDEGLTATVIFDV
jgi:SHS2 domain-containing protein